MKTSVKKTSGKKLGAKLENAGKKSAPVKTAEKSTETKTAKTGKYGAPAQRPNRANTEKSAFGNRKWVFRGVTEFDVKTNKLGATDPIQSKPFKRADAEKILQKCLELPDVVNGRLFYKKPDADGNAMAGVYIAYVADNGDYRAKQ